MDFFCGRTQKKSKEKNFTRKKKGNKTKRKLGRAAFFCKLLIFKDLVFFITNQN